MSTTWRNQIRDEVIEKYEKKKRVMEENMRIKSIMDERKRSACELETPVDTFMNQGGYYYVPTE